MKRKEPSYEECTVLEAIAEEERQDELDALDCIAKQSRIHFERCQVAGPFDAARCWFDYKHFRSAADRVQHTIDCKDSRTRCPCLATETNYDVDFQDNKEMRFCAPHLKQMKEAVAKAHRKCRECDKPVHARDLCRKHAYPDWERQRSTPPPSLSAPEPDTEVEEEEEEEEEEEKVKRKRARRTVLKCLGCPTLPFKTSTALRRHALSAPHMLWVCDCGYSGQLSQYSSLVKHAKQRQARKSFTPQTMPCGTKTAKRWLAQIKSSPAYRHAFSKSKDTLIFKGNLFKTMFAALQ